MPAIVTVVIPCYNADDTIGDALLSLEKQTMPEWEAIVVNDGSTDDSMKVVEGFAQINERISLLNQPNKGPSIARNEGLKAAKGRYVHFLDSDDWIDPKTFELCIKAIEYRPEFGAIHCGQAFAVNHRANFRPRERFTKTGKLFFDLCERNPFPPGSLFLKRDLFDTTGLLFDPDVPGCEDWDMWLRIARLGTEFGCIDKICFFYRLREGSFSNKARMMWESGSKVIERAFRPDSRVNDPEPDFAQGGNIERKTMVRFRYALACCSLALVEHDVQTAINIFDLECSKINKAGDPVIIADALRHNIWNASSIESGDWVSLWPIIGTALFDFLSYVERRLNIPGYGGECLRSLMGIDKLEAIRESTSYRIGRTITRFKFW